ncbi:MAG: Ig-like domain-containing protein [Lachnospiraceae bacterium]|nr:Ig-like domain-containing protein [Lachnospiraceae bacterium]
MKTRMKVLVFALAAFFLVSGSTAYAAEFLLSASKVTINVGETYDIDVVDSNVNPRWTAWSINNVKIDQNGVVTGVRKGTAVVSARVGLKIQTCKVTVVEPSIKLNKTTALLYSGEGTSQSTLQLKATVKGAGKAVTWKSDKPNVAKVDENGQVTSVAPGTAVITATGNGKEAACKVTVKKNSLTLNMANLQLSTKGNGSSIKLVPTIVGSKKNIVWTSSDKKVATVSGGKVTGKSSGTAEITATVNGISAKCTVTVIKDSLSINTEKELLYVNEKKQLKTNAGKKDVVAWTSSNNGVVTVDEKGNLVAVAAGNAVITATLGDSSDRCEVIVKNTTTNIGEDVIELKTKGTYQKHTLGLHIEGRKNAVKWTSSDKSIATVNAKGMVTGKKAGEITITAEANGVKDSVAVKVADYRPTVKLNHQEYVLYTNKGNTVTLKATVDGPVKKAVWASSEPQVASVTNGKVKALQAGQTVITATANGITEDCVITVKESEVLLETGSLLLTTGETAELPSDIVGNSQKATYKTTDAKVVSVKNGIITAKKAGKAEIKVTANKATGICQVTVIDSSCTHQYGQATVTKEASCKEEGSKTAVCSQCQHERTESMEKREHSFRVTERIEAGCEVHGTIRSECSVCGELKEEILPEKGHSFGDWKKVTTPTDFTDGSYKQTCSVCGEENRSVTLPANDNQGGSGQQPGGETPGGNEGEQPGGENPGGSEGEQPGGETPGGNEGEQPGGSEEPGGSEGGQQPGGSEGGQQPGGSEGEQPGGENPGGSEDPTEPGEGENPGGGDEPNPPVEPEDPSETDTIALDFKDIEAVSLYYEGNEVEVVDKAKGVPGGEELAKYYLEIEPKFAPKLYVGVKAFEQGEKQNEIYAVADLKNFDASFVFAYENRSGASTVDTVAQAFINSIIANPQGEFTLTQDIDVSGLTLSNGYLVNAEFKGTLNGNGYTIYGLKGSLFSKIVGGKVNNLVIEDAEISGTNAILAPVINSNAVIDGVKIINSTLTNGSSSTGGSVGAIGGNVQNAQIKNCEVRDSSITGYSSVGGIGGTIKSTTVQGCIVVGTMVSGNNTIGGLIGDLGSNGQVSDCLVKANLSGSQSGNQNGARVAGIAGWHNSTASISKCYVEVSISSSDKKGCGGIFGAPKETAGAVSDCYVAVTGSAYQISGFEAAMGTVNNTYQLSSATNKNTGTGVKETQALTEELFKTTLGLKVEFWQIIKPDTTLLGENSVLTSVEGFNAAKEQVYYNLIKLAPFAESEKIVTLGNTLTGNLADKVVAGVYPYDNNNNLIITMDESQVASVKKVKVVYKDGKFDSYDVIHEKTADGIVDVYKIKDKELPYHFNKYLNNDALGLEEYISELASDYSYDEDISSVYSGDVVRQYREIYNTDIVPKLDDYAQMLVGTEYASKTANAYLKAKLEAKIEEELKKLLYTYTYYMKGYDFVMGGANMADLFYFDSELLNEEVDLTYLVNELSSSSRAMNSLYNNYTSQIASKSGIGLYDQFELMLSMAGVTDYNQWFIDNWGGYVKTQEMIGYTPTPLLRYKIWDNLTALTGTDAHLMFLLTIPEELQKQFGILTTASQILISEVNIYFEGAPTDANIETFRKKFDTMAPNYGKYYGSTLNYVTNGEANLNNSLCIGYDTYEKFKKEEFKVTSAGAKTTEAPHVKWIVEPANQTYISGAGAVATGKYIYYGYMYGLGEFGIFTHENAHNQDSSYFLNGEGRRTTNGEYFAEGFLTEPISSSNSEERGDFTINRLNEFSINADGIMALSYERVNTAEELQDYYKDLFDSGYAVDTIMGNAMIHAKDNVKYKNGYIAVIQEAQDNKGNNLPYIWETTYNYWQNSGMVYLMNSFEGLYDNKVVYNDRIPRRGGYAVSSFWNANWYVPSNPNGVADAGTFKTMAYELLGEAGWNNGFIGWSSARYSNDEEAIKEITGYNGMREYKLARFAEAQSKLSSIPYFDAVRIEKVFDNIYTADAAKSGRGYVDNGMAMKEILVQAVKRSTNDFLDGNFYEKPKNTYYEVSDASQFLTIVNENSMKTGVFIKLTGDLDFTNVAGANGYYGEHFIGIIDGGDHTIKGLTKPLFKSARFSVIHDITFESTATNILIANAGSSSYNLAYDCNFGEGKTLYGSTDATKMMFEVFMNEPEAEPEVTPSSVVTDFQAITLQNVAEKLTEKSEEEDEESEITCEEVQEAESREASEALQEADTQEVQETQEEASEEYEATSDKTQEADSQEAQEDVHGEDKK